MKARLDEIKRFQKLAGIASKKSLLVKESIFNEEENNKDKEESGEEKKKVSVPPSVSAAASVFDLDAIKKQAKEKGEKLDEALTVLTAIGIILAIPALLQGLATMIEKGKRAFSKIPKEEVEKIKAHNLAVAKGEITGHKKYTSEVSKELDEFAHFLHDMMIKPIEGVLWTLSKVPGIGRIKFLKDEKLRHKLAEGIYLLVAIGIGGVGVASHAASITGVIDMVKLGDAAIDANAFATTSGLLKKGPDLLLKMVS